MGVALLDSSVLVAFLNGDDTLHAAADAAVRDVAREHAFAVSTVTIAETLTGAKLGHHDETILRRFLAAIVGARLPVDVQVAERAAELRAANRALRTPDALVLATGELHADVVVTGDKRWTTVRDVGCEIVAIGG
ncbi:PIN domain-containing protein [Conexibacter sp. JD483]|uniref:PIN domain-containing protein n=1 Tax=unclassified Conexibacter TaxID=2627773 RepID=UPI002720E6D1|nr:MULTISPECIES: PIN domain-containing protein [unclassified Conexibacter]MDO8187854.1 PIN domain-containing protein [Conexibacter sp. CPCC 205706]MDO8201206.1 PIN domain-containing protein [Conexibacter sp. CPCC 205762]MDR9369782.1 PIN domain-containing protein [Conexibacter sp. JD483]